MLRMTRLNVLPLILLTAVVAVWPFAEASASSEPAPITALTGATEPLTQQQRQQVRAWVDWWSRELASGDADRVAQGRRRLLDPLRATTVRLLFRETYSEFLVDRIETIVRESADLHVAVNALQIAAMLGTESAARLMTSIADPLEEQRPQVRLWAVHGVRTIFRTGVIDEGRYPGILRDLSRAGLRETNWLVLQRHFDALGAAGTDGARERQIALLNDVLNRIEENQDGPHDIIRAVHYAVVVFRDQFANLRRSEQQAFGTQAAPVIGRVFQIASKHWEQVDDANLTASYGGAVQISEAMLSIIDDLVRGENAAPQTRIGDAWASRNRQSFQQDSDRWLSVLRRPPYGDHR